MSTEPPLPPEPTSLASEPLLSVGAWVSVATAALTLVMSFGLHLKVGQREAILTFVAVLVPMVVAVYGRSKVYSPRSVLRLLSAARSRRSPLR